MYLTKLSDDEWSFGMSSSEADQLFLALLDSPSSAKNTFMKTMADHFGFEYTPVTPTEAEATEVPKKALPKNVLGYGLNPFSKSAIGGPYNDLHTSKSDYIHGFAAVVNDPAVMGQIFNFYALGQKIYAIKEIRAFLMATKFKTASGLYCAKCMCDVLFEAFNKIKGAGGKITAYTYHIDSSLLLTTA